MKRFLKITGIVLLIILILIIILVSVGYFYVRGKLNKINYVKLDETKLGVTTEAEENLQEYRNIVLLGIDDRFQSTNTLETHDSKTDCIIIASINENTNEVKLTSVYRDTFVEIEGYGLTNVNFAYNYGGPELTIATLNKNLDLNIKEFVAVNFNAVAALVNSVDGIELEITDEEVSYMNDYIKVLKEESGMETDKIKSAGVQHIDGVQAVAYSRIRYTAGGDNKRTERMRTVLVKTFEKLKTKSIAELNNIADDLLPRVYTNINSNEIFSMIPEITKFNVSSNIGWPYTMDSIQFADGLWHSVPLNLDENVELLHRNVFKEDDYIVNNVIKSISNRVKEVYDNEKATSGE